MSRYPANHPKLQAWGNQALVGSRQDGVTAYNNGGVEHSPEPNHNTHIGSFDALPMTPKLNPPNSGRKRLHTPGLSRTTTTPSHSVKMSNIFHDAAASIREYQTPSCQTPSNTKRSRIPLLQARSVQFGSVGRQGTPKSLQTNSPSGSQLHASPTPLRALTPPDILTGSHFPTPPMYGFSPQNRQENTMNSQGPVSSDFITPLLPPHDIIPSYENVIYPRLNPLPKDSPFTSSDEETHSTHGVPLIIPFSNPSQPAPQNPNITAWLDDVVEDPSSSPLPSPPTRPTSESRKTRKAITTKAKPLLALLHSSCSPSKRATRSPSYTSSNKENRSPSMAFLANTRGKGFAPPSSPFPFPTNSPPPPTTTPTGASTFHALFPTSRVSKQSKTHVKATGNENKEAERDEKGFKILDEEEMVQLSPGVEKFRKGKGPRGKRERCGSYWDEDILRVDEESVEGDQKGEGEKVAVGEVRRGRRVLVEREDVGEGKGVAVEFGFRA